LRAFGWRRCRVLATETNRGAPHDLADSSDSLRREPAHPDLDISLHLIDAGGLHANGKTALEILEDFIQLLRGEGHLYRDDPDTGKLGLEASLLSLDVGIVESDANPTVVSPVDPYFLEVVEGLGERSHVVDGHLIADVDRGVCIPVLWGIRHVDVFAKHDLHRGRGGRRDAARLRPTAGCGLGAGDYTKKQQDNESDVGRWPHEYSTPVVIAGFLYRANTSST
jgi:hypothetical protein